MAPDDGRSPGCDLREPAEESIGKVMETIEGVGTPHDQRRDEGVLQRPPGQTDEDATTPMAKLVDADRHLLAIGAEVAALRDELARLREEAGARAELLAEREVVIAELSGLLPTLEEARVHALRQSEAASSALAQTQARVSEYARQVVELQQRLASIDEANAARDGAVRKLEAQLADERASREESERALADAHAVSRAAEVSLAESRTRLASLSGDYERLLAEREEERAEAQRQAEVTSAAVHASESRLSREVGRVARLERELETLEAALAERVVSLSDLEHKLAEARSEHEEASAAAAEPPSRSAEQLNPTHLRFVLRSGGYTVTESDGQPPRPGEVVEFEGQRFTVAKVAPSPLPRDLRPCVYLLVENGWHIAN